MSGEHGGFGYSFQNWSILQTALECWGDGRSDVAALLIEGEPGQDAVDRTVVGEDGRHRLLSPTRSRGRQRTISAREIIDALLAMRAYGVTDGARLEFVTNGRSGTSAEALVDALGSVRLGDDRALVEVLNRAQLSDLAVPDVLEALRASVVTLRPAPLH
jgi:hypothetical protein